MPSSTFRWAIRWLVVLFCLVNSTLIVAQSTGGRILGRVADPTGAVLANVKVTLANEATGVARDTKTNASGDYNFLEVVPGNYTAEFEQSGFKKNVQKNVTVEVNQVVTLNSTLQPGGAKEVVEVTSEAPLVDTTSTQLGAVVNERAVTQLPLNSRDTYQLLQLQPGVQSQIGSDLFYGSNQLHGSVYEFFRNKVLNARGFFDLEKPDFKQNQFGATLGGPVKKDRTFFFTSYEGRRLVHGVSSGSVTVPTDAERQGDFSGETPFAGTVDTDTAAAILNERPGCAAAVPPGSIFVGANYSDIFVNNIIPNECMDPVAVDLLRFVPHGNLPDGTFSGVPISRDRADQFTVRLDHRINAQQQFSAYYYFTD